MAKIGVLGDKVMLFLEHERREIGRITTDSLIVKRSREKHLHRKSNSYGFNAYIVENATRFNSIILIDDYGQYKISLDLIKKEGKYLHFQKQGFEKQMFLSLDIIEKQKIKEWI